MYQNDCFVPVFAGVYSSSSTTVSYFSTPAIKLRRMKIVSSRGNREFIPVRKGNVGYLFDKLSGKLYGNASSSGALLYGNDV